MNGATCQAQESVCAFWMVNAEQIPVSLPVQFINVTPNNLKSEPNHLSGLLSDDVDTFQPCISSIGDITQ